MRVHLTGAQYGELRAYLFSSPERVGFLFARTTGPDTDTRVEQSRLLNEHEYLRHDRHGVELAEHVRPELIRTAHHYGYAVIEAHAHNWPGMGTRFSRTDLDGLRDLGPHMTWRLPGRPYAALVLGPDSFDALQWQTSGEVTTLEAMIVDGHIMRPTGLSSRRLTDAIPGGSHDQGL
jgi:hypothetical protein